MEIKKGDLVQIIAPRSCGCAGTIGVVATVGDDDNDERLLECVDCGAVYPQRSRMVHLVGRRGVEVIRLKKIDPPSTGELKGVPLRLKEPV